MVTYDHMLREVSHTSHPFARGRSAELIDPENDQVQEEVKLDEFCISLLAANSYLGIDPQQRCNRPLNGLVEGENLSIRGARDRGKVNHIRNIYSVNKIDFPWLIINDFMRIFSQ